MFQFLILLLLLALVVGYDNYYKSNYSYNPNYSYYDYLQFIFLPTHLFFLLAVLVLFLGFTWYVNYESMLEDLMDQVKLALVLLPLVLLLVVHWLSSNDSSHEPFISLPEQDSLHRAGGSPWGVAVLLVFLLYMVSHHTSLQERWYPMLSRR